PARLESRYQHARPLLRAGEGSRCSCRIARVLACSFRELTRNKVFRGSESPLFFLLPRARVHIPLHCARNMKVSKNYREAGNPVILTCTGTNLALPSSLPPSP